MRKILASFIALSMMVSFMPLSYATEDTQMTEVSEVENTNEEQGSGYIVVVNEDLLKNSDINILDYLEPMKYVDGYYTVDSLLGLDFLIENGIIVEIFENEVIKLPDTDVDTGIRTLSDEEPDDAHHDLIQTSVAWDAGLTGKGITVAVIDSGIYKDHMEFDNLTVSSDSYNTLSTYNSTDLSDGTGHGSFVTSVIAADHDNIGVSGTTPDATVMVLKTFSSANADTDDIVEAIGYAVKQGVDVINLSLGGTTTNFKNAIESTLKTAYEQGILIVASAGNDGDADYYYPAAFDFVMGVGMVDTSGVVASNSQKNDSVFVTAPGSVIWGVSTTGTNYYKTGSGTSYSAPIISSLGVMAKQVAPNITMDGFFDLIEISVDDKGDTGYDTSYGYGLINVATYTENLTYNNDIIYNLDGGTNPENAPATYVVGRGNDNVTLPTPTKTGYIFEGFYQTEDFSDEKMPETLSFDQVGDLELYAKWSMDTDITITVQEYEAILKENTESEYIATVPYGTSVEISDFTVYTVCPDTVVSSVTDETDYFGFDITFDTGDVSYKVYVEYSDATPPTIKDEASFETTLSPGSLDGKTDAETYKVSNIEEWFENTYEDTVYAVEENEYSQRISLADIDEDGYIDLVITPTTGDASKTLTFNIYAQNETFKSGNIVVTVNVSDLADSTSIADTTDITFIVNDSEDVSIDITPYGNDVTEVKVDDKELILDTDYTYSEDTLIISKAVLNELSADEYTITISFSAGEPSEISLTVELQEFAVKFISESATYYETTVYDGETATFPSDDPTKTDYTFEGWYDAETDGTEYTNQSVITSDIVLYAVFKVVETTTSTDTGTTGGGTTGGGGSIVIVETVVEAEVEVEEGFEGAILLEVSDDWENPFEDVDENAWYYEAVALLSVNGIINGTSDTTFSPDLDITRQQIWTILARVLGQEVADYDEALEWAVENEISDGTYPENTLTREQLVTILWRMSGSITENADLPDDYTDIDEISEYAIEAFKWAYENGILLGVTDTELSPSGNVTRAQVVVILMRYLAQGE